MNEITRFDIDMNGEMESSEDGQWVYYDDIPKPKEWVGLTDNQLVDLVIKNAGFPTKLAEAIEAKLKAKNGY